MLTEAETDAVRAHVDQYTHALDTLPPEHQAPMAGPGEFLINHPRVIGILSELIDPEPSNLRMESVFVSRRSVSGGGEEGWRPHAGSNILPSFNYSYQNGRMYAG